MHAKRLRSIVAAFAVAALSSLLLPFALQAQWQVSYTFSSQVRAVYFLNNQGQPSTGFVGLVDGEIWRTLDNGQSWIRVNAPAELGSITSFAFKDAMQGWCSVRPLNTTKPSCWMTTDGGLNWTALTPAGNSVDVSYNPASQLLFLVCWNGGSQVSSDLGKTWSTFAPTNQNGITWSDATHGILSVLSGAFYRTSDAGISWQAVPPMNVECWSPTAVANTSTILAAGEKTHTIYRSNDNGASWSAASVFSPYINLVGDIEGNASYLFVQTLNNGFYSSTDLGTTWQSICGPSNDRDTRFYAKGTEIFAGTPTGALWHLPSVAPNGPNQNALQIERTRINFVNLGCFSADSLIRISFNGTCPLSFTRVQLTGSRSFKLGAYGALPRSLSGRDSLNVIYAPTHSGADTAQLLVEYFINFVRYDTTINLYGLSLRTLDYSQSLTRWYPMFGSSCDERDTAVSFKNRSCDTLFLTSASVDDSTAFQLAQLQFPITILPGDSTKLLLHCEHHQPGDFTATLNVSLQSGNQLRDTSVSLEVYIPSVARPTIDPLAATLASKCVTLDTTINVTNSFCDTIFLNYAKLSDSTYFSLRNTPQTKIAPGQSMSLLVHIITTGKGTKTTSLLLEFGGSGAPFDTAITIAATTVGEIPLTAQLSSDQVAFGQVSTCNVKQMLLNIGNRQCRDLIITKLALPDQDSAFVASSTLSLPDTLRPGSVDSLIILFHPHHAGGTSSYITLTLSADGVSKDTLIEISGSGYETVSAEFSPSALDFGTLSTCGSSSGKAFLVNNSCDSIYVTEAHLQLFSRFELDSVKLPTWMHRGDSLSFAISIASPFAGKFKDSIEVRMRPGSISSPEVSRTLPLLANVERTVAKLFLTPASFTIDSISPCYSRDTVIMFTNPSPCEAMTIEDITESGDSSLSFSVALPIHLAPGKSVSVSVTLQPKAGSQTITKLRIVGPTTDTSILFTLSTRQPDRTFALLALDTNFVTRPCEIVRHSYTITSTGCQDVAIDSLTLTSNDKQMRFAFDSSVSLPLDLAPGDSRVVSLLYDPNQLGDSIASLNVGSNAGVMRSVLLTGSTIGSIQHTELDVLADDLTGTETVKVNDVARASLIFRNDVPAKLGLTMVQCTITYDRDVLQLENIVPANNWRLIDTTALGNGIYSVTLGSSSATSFVAGDKLASFTFTTSVAKSPSSVLQLGSIKFNGGDSLYANCIMSSDAPRDLLIVTMNNACGDSLIRVALGNEPIIVERVTPNPIFDAPAYIEVDLLAQRATIVNVSIVDAGGVIRRTWAQRSLTQGASKLLLDMNGLPDGAYFLTIESPYQTVVRKVIIAR